ncbi:MULTISPECIES: glycosyltransferase family 2 protein [Acidobacterium]|uniref:glycosyltransferase n=1 Tax=Acidobacterium TaxID=33973 RepID=UPI00030B7D52|nr:MULTISPECIES: glycosyltransferase family 2 protein [Acidobacterium]
MPDLKEEPQKEQDIDSAPSPSRVLSVIVPARNEEDCIEACLRSLAVQSEPGWDLGREWEILLVNDASTDRTRALAAAIPGVTVLDAPPPEPGWTGKANACMAGVRAARGQWLLFTDADTVHEPGHLSLAITEAERHHVEMLSYSPRQIVHGFWQRALMPLVFSELASAYPPAKVNDPAHRTAAANGQFLLVRREAYEKIGGHAAVMDFVLEDVALANLAKRRKVGLRFRYAPEAVAAHMYRDFQAMWQGWTKNLALLFGNALALAAWRLLDLVLLLGLPFGAWAVYRLNPHVWYWAVFLLLWLRTLLRFYRRVSRSNFAAKDCMLAPVGLPLFAAMLWQSWFDHTVKKRVVWKGRTLESANR